MNLPRPQFRLSTLLWITLAVACWFGGAAWESVDARLWQAMTPAERAAEQDRQFELWHLNTNIELENRRRLKRGWSPRPAIPDYSPIEKLWEKLLGRPLTVPPRGWKPAPVQAAPPKK